MPVTALRLLLPAALLVLAAVKAGAQCIGPDILVGGVKSVDNFAETEPNGRAAHFGIPMSPCRGNGWNLPVLTFTQNAGLSWPPQAQVETDCAYAGQAMLGCMAIGADGAGKVYAGWLAGADGQEFPVIRVSPSDALTWPGATHTLAAPAKSSGPQVVTGGPGEAWMFWRATDATGAYPLHYSYTSDGGATFSPARTVDIGWPTDLGRLTIHRDEAGTLHGIALGGTTGDGRVIYTRSTDKGETWSTAATIDGRSTGAKMLFPALLTLPGGRLLAYWQDDRDGRTDVFARLSADAGITWPDPPARVDLGDAPGAAVSREPIVVRAGADGELCAAWIDDRDGTWKVYTSTSSDHGAAWSATPVPVSGSDVWDNFLLFGDVDTGWVRLIGDGSLTYTSLSTDGGRTFAASSSLGPPPGYMLTAVQYPFGAHGLLYTDPQFLTHHIRLDGPAAVEAMGPTTYCQGSDPRLEARAATARCPAWLYQWHVDGVAQPGATAFEFTPALGLGDHTVEVRVTCTTPVSCTPPSVPLALHVLTPTAPPGVGNQLKVVRAAGSWIKLDWSGAPPAPGAHAHVGRALGRLGGYTPVAPEHSLTASELQLLPPSGEDLVLYRVLRADPCEAESAD